MGAKQLLFSLAIAALNLLPLFNSYAAAFSSSSQPPLPPPPASLLPLPTNPDDVIRQAANSISKAFIEDGINLQTIRLPLSESIYGDKEEGFVADRAIGWQGGPQETYRYLSPMVSKLLQTIKMTGNAGGLVAKVSEQVLLDFDGSSLQTSEHPAGPLYDVQALLQPNTDAYYTKTIETIQEQFSNTDGKTKRLFLLVNPAWRDRSSWGFFGGKKAQELILDRCETTYAVDQFVVRGKKISLLKCWSDDWVLFVKNDQDPSMPAERMATFASRPEYKDIDEVLLTHAKRKVEKPI